MLSEVSINKLTVYLSVITTALITLIFIMLTFLFFDSFNWWSLILFIIISFLLIFAVLYTFLNRFIFKRLQVIYNIIRGSKLNTKESKTNASQPLKQSISDVNNEAKEWAERTEKEINSLKSLERYRKDFVGNISHELKTPIFSIQGYLHTLIDGGMYDENVNEKFLRKAISNASRLQTIVEDLELINKFESGSPVFSMEVFDIKELVAEIFTDLEGMAKEKNIRLNYNNEASTTFMVKADQESIRQVLVNLIVNSIKYGKENGNTSIGFFDMTDNILIEVEDDGIGIQEKHLKHLFDRFYRVDKGRSRHEGGSGLGLSIVKHIIEAHDQTINVRSTINEGSTFGFTIQKSN